MAFWNKLGKIALTAAPYVAAPFTGGMSLATTGLANAAVQKWNQKDAEKAMARGLAPSKFDQNLGRVGQIGGLASNFIMPSGGSALTNAIVGGASNFGASKLGGESWGKAALAGGIGAGSGYVRGKIGQKMAAKKGIGPSDYVRKDVADVAGKVAAPSKGLSTGQKVGLGVLGGGVAGATIAGLANRNKGNEYQGDDYWGPGAQSDFGPWEERNPSGTEAMRRGESRARAEIQARQGRGRRRRRGGLGPSRRYVA